ncbi:hypothetical protein E2974_08205 [Paracoccus yeei]
MQDWLRNMRKSMWPFMPLIRSCGACVSPPPDRLSAGKFPFSPAFNGNFLRCGRMGDLRPQGNRTALVKSGGNLRKKVSVISVQ